MASSTATSSNNSHDTASTDVFTVRQKCGYSSELARGLYLNHEMANVFFTFPNSTERVPALNYILSAGSSVFDKMFFGSSAVLKGDIPIVGHTPDAFKEFLQFFYLDEVTIKSNNIMGVIRLLHAYEMPKCLELCGQFWLKHYDSSNIDFICLAYEFAIKFKMTEFQKQCEQKIAIHCAEVMKTTSFLSCSFGVLDRILGLDSLLCDESVILAACLDWGRYKCKQNGKNENEVENLREYLIDNTKGANLLHKIRFVSISHGDYLVHLDAIDAILTNGTERTDVARLVLGSTDVKSNKFQTAPRKPFWNDEQAINYVVPKKEIGPEFNVDERHVHVFKVNKSVLLGGFYIVPMKTTNLRSGAIIVNVSIDERRIVDGAGESGKGSGGGGNVVNTVIKSIHTERVTVTERTSEFVQFTPNPIFIEANLEYHIVFDFKSNQHGDECDLISFHDEVESNQEIKLKDGLTIQYGAVNDGKNGRLLIKGFKLMQL